MRVAARCAQLLRMQCLLTGMLKKGGGLCVGIVFFMTPPGATSNAPWSPTVMHWWGATLA